MDGIKFYIIPDFKRLLDLNVWIDASQQIFFSLGILFIYFQTNQSNPLHRFVQILGIAWGMIITMSSYNDFSHHLIRDATIIAFGNRSDH